jgi:exportin-1
MHVCHTSLQIIKHEWPHSWPNFIPEIVASSKTNESLCENNMSILKSFRYVTLAPRHSHALCLISCHFIHFHFSEEVFDFSAGHMTQAKIKELKQSFNKV